MKFSKFYELVNRILSNKHSQRRDMDVTIVVHSLGRIGSTPSVEVQSIQAGFDWDAGQVMIFPAQPLTALTPEQVDDITESVRKGQSWHAYQEYKNHKEQLEKLSIELDAAKQRVAELEVSRAALAAENAGMKEVINEVRSIIANSHGVSGWHQNGDIAEWDEVLPEIDSVETPATDAFLAEVRAQGVEMLAKNHQSIVDKLKGDSLFSDGEYRHAVIASAAASFAAELRKGGNQ